VGDWMIWNNQLTKFWSLTFCGGREVNYGNTTDGVCPIQCVNWGHLLNIFGKSSEKQFGPSSSFLNVSQKWYCLGQLALC
jgi:hypothetical protein